MKNVMLFKRELDTCLSLYFILKKFHSDTKEFCFICVINKKVGSCKLV